MGKLDTTRGASDGQWFEAPDVVLLKTAAEGWREGAAKDRLSNRRFLDLFAVYLVKHFKAEEARLKAKDAPGQAWHRQEHLRIVRRIWDLMSDVSLGLEVTDGIHRLLEAWFLHQEAAAQRRDEQGFSGH